MSVSTKMPMIQCSSCGKYTAHIMDQYHNAVLILSDQHEDLLSGKSIVAGGDLEKLDTVQPIWKNWLSRYYSYMQAQKKEKTDEEYKKMANLYKVKALVCKAILAHKPLTEDELPLHEHERSNGSVRQCCRRSLMCDDSISAH